MKKTIKVVFKEDVQKYSKGDEAQVALGYARNYLLPKKLAIKSNDPEAKKIILKLKEERAKFQAEIDKLTRLAQDIQGKEIIIIAKTTSGGKLYGSIDAKKVAKKLKLEKILSYEPEEIKMKPIKTIGEHEIQLDLGHNIKANLKIKVETKK